jgi:hypothetical protein
MKRKYRIFIRGDITHDLKQRIVAVHTAGILNGKSREPRNAENDDPSQTNKTRLVIRL